MASGELGYNLLPPSREHEPGYSGAKIFLCEPPTQLHFDPKIVLLTVATPTNEIERLTIRHPWHTNQYRLCAGSIHIEDAVRKEVELFTYGGDLIVDAGPDCTTCEIHSPAPVLGNFSEHSIGRLLAEETEIILAQERVDFLEDENVFDRRLATLDPLDLYYASLSTLLDRFQHLNESYDGLSVRLVHTIKGEIDYLRTSPQYGNRFTIEKKLIDLFR